MKILIYALNYAPEPVGVGRYTTEMAQWLQQAGHEVRVVTSMPYYPSWKLERGYRRRSYLRDKQMDVPTWRAPLWVPFRPGGTKRVLHLMSFAVTSAPALLRHWLWRPDVVWMPAPAFVCAPNALAFARACGAKAWLHVQDYEVDIAFETGLLKGERVKGWVKGLERWILQRFDRVSSISTAMMDRARGDKRLAEERLHALPNWVDVHAITPQTGPNAIREELGIPADAVVALYSGSMGPKHGVEQLADVALLLKVHADKLYFVFCGEGAGKPLLEAKCGAMPNVRLLPLQPLERLNELLGMADIHMLPQRPSAGDLVMPSKLTGMLSSGRPVVATALPGTELDQVVRGCGIVVPPGDVEAMAWALTRLMNDPEWRAQLGQKARRYAETHLALDAVLARFERELHKLVGKLPAGETLPVETADKVLDVEAS